MLRVTDNIMFNSMKRGVMRAQERIYEKGNIAQSGVRVSTPSDDPLAAARANVLNRGLSKLENMGRVGALAGEELAVTESTLSSAADVLLRIRELAIQAANGGLNATDRDTIGMEVAELRKQMLTLANTKVLDSYIFGGFKTNAEAFNSSGVYQGDTGNREVEVAPGIKVGLNLAGNEVFGDSSTGVDIFAILSSLSTALSSNNVDGIQQQLDNLDTSYSQVLKARSKVGTWLASVGSAESLRSQIEESMLTQRSAAIDVDATVAFSDFTQAQFALQAAVSQAQRIIDRLSSRLF